MSRMSTRVISLSASSYSDAEREEEEEERINRDCAKKLAPANGSEREREQRGAHLWVTA